MWTKWTMQRKTLVAPLAGSVDRNSLTWTSSPRNATVAPLAGSVDRNIGVTDIAPVSPVAPLAGSVDRNIADAYTKECSYRRSPRGERG